MNPRPRRLPARLGVLLAVGAAMLALGALPASAHIRVSAEGGATPGSYAQLAFRVPKIGRASCRERVYVLV